MREELTDKAIKARKPPEKGRLEIMDTRCAGLAFRVTSNGARSWSFRYHSPHSGKLQRLTIGQYPTISLGRARVRAEELRREVAEGVNPAQVKKQAKAEADTKTVAALASRYMAEHSRRRKRSADADERNLRLHILPAWGDRPYATITRADVVELAEKLVASERPVLANRVVALVSSIFSFAIDAGLVEANPCTRLRKRGVETRKTRVLSDDELRLFWRCAVLPPVSRVVGLALRLCLLTGMRAGEVAGLALSEIEHLDDPERAAITIPGGRTKNGRIHFCPLAPLAVATINEALALSQGEHVFAPRGGAIEGHVLAVAMRRMVDALPDAPGADTWRADAFSPHDLRRTVATRMAALGVPGEDVSAVLGHTPQHITKQVYDQYTRAREKRVALNTWANALASICGNDCGN